MHQVCLPLLILSPLVLSASLVSDLTAVLSSTFTTGFSVFDVARFLADFLRVGLPDYSEQQTKMKKYLQLVMKFLHAKHGHHFYIIMWPPVKHTFEFGSGLWLKCKKWHFLHSSAFILNCFLHENECLQYIKTQ